MEKLRLNEVDMEKGKSGPMEFLRRTFVTEWYAHGKRIFVKHSVTNLAGRTRQHWATKLDGDVTWIATFRTAERAVEFWGEHLWHPDYRL